jgi:hypothetical protein
VPTPMINHYRRQADAFLALAREEANAEVKLLFLELADGYRMRADDATRAQPASAAAIPAAA